MTWALALRPIRVAKTNHPRPTDRKTSPTLATLRRTGNGIGRMSPRGAAWSRMLIPVGSGRRRWNCGIRSAAVIPAADSAPDQTGIHPPLAIMATALAATPTPATSRPGWSRFSQRP